jgi:hypothetical protein
VAVEKACVLCRNRRKAMKVGYRKTIKINIGNYENTDCTAWAEDEIGDNADIEDIRTVFADLKNSVYEELKEDIKDIDSKETNRFGIPR